MADKAFGSGEGMNPRKAMGSGLAKGGDDFGVAAYPGHGHKVHPDATSNLGSAGAMDDGERAIGAPIQHAKGHQPAQAAPHHGPHHEAEMGFDRGPSKGY